MESLDIEQPQALIRYLRRTGRVGAKEQIQIRKLTGGVSNRTVLVERPTGEAWVLKQALPKLRVPVDWFSSPARTHREALGLQWLARLAPAESITPFVFEDRQHHLLAMHAVGQPHHNWKSLLLAGQLDLNHVRQFGALLGTIHRKALAFKKEISRIFGDRSFFESLRVEPYYAYTAQQIPTAGFLTNLIRETRRRHITLVHGDYSPKNILIYRNHLVLLDHEVIHFGDPAFDLGFSLTHLLSKAHHVTALRPALAQAAKYYWQVYIEVLDPAEGTTDLEEQVVLHTLGCLLARVSGRSQLEYFSQGERVRQREIVMGLMQDPPLDVPRLIEEFISRLGSHAYD
ncbi:phosphotransferase [Acidobacteria bacterium AH-259-G07]|nr:phosphotransferase [Acidobacteria bacterium AH-259-G07]